MFMRAVSVESWMSLEFTPVSPSSSGQLHALPLFSWILRTASPSLIPQTGEDQCHIAEVFPCQAEQMIITSVSSRELMEVLEGGNNLIIAAFYGG